jgi:1,2-diacylglycerol 3-alpha-glucosyltransferase
MRTHPLDSLRARDQFRSKVASPSRWRHAPVPDDLPGHVGLLNDYLRIPFATGSSFATQFLYRELRASGHRVTVVGPHDPEAQLEDLPEHRVELSSVPLRMHPGLYLPMPNAADLARVAAQRFDVVLGQTATELTDLGVWLRAAHHVPLLCVNTVHVPAVYSVLLPEALMREPRIHDLFQERIMPWLAQHSAHVYNLSDGMVVLSHGLERYWRQHGVEVPIHVIPRSVDSVIFDRPAACDPFPATSPRGGRLLCVCRHSREKDVDRLLALFAAHVASELPEATLTLVGDGPEHEAYRACADALGIAHRVHFVGEVPLTELTDYYRNADLFLYPSLSETYGQVVSEAMYCGLPVVAFADGMGVSDQIQHPDSSILVAPGPDRELADAAFAAEVLALMRHPLRRRVMSQLAATHARRRTAKGRVMDMYYAAFEHARQHCFATTQRRVGAPLSPLAALQRWAFIQTLIAGLGCLRPKVTVNRHGRRQPGWQELELTPSRIAERERSITLATASVPA